VLYILHVLLHLLLNVDILRDAGGTACSFSDDTC
jgi:hypothetical protein